MEIREHALVELLTAGFRRAPHQRNRIRESDAELLSGSWNGSPILAVTTDTLAEEIASGLYTDPWLIGWMSVMANMSDLAAVGATPLGILLAATIPPGYPEASACRLREGIRSACDTCSTYLLGGDTNFGDSLSITGCALGTIGPEGAVSRVGCRAGDVLFSSGPLGSGSAFAVAALFPGFTEAVSYRPVARLREGTILRSYATACMDTSDGAIATLDELMRLNGTGFLLEEGWEQVLDCSAHELVGALEVPPWVALAGEHGEFELVFTVPPDRISRMLDAAAEIGWRPFRLGVAQKSIRVDVMDAVSRTTLLTAGIRNVFGLAAKDLRAYLAALKSMATMHPFQTIPRQQPDISIPRQGYHDDEESH